LLAQFALQALDRSFMRLDASIMEGGDRFQSSGSCSGGARRPGIVATLASRAGDWPPSGQLGFGHAVARLFARELFNAGQCLSDRG